jgi:hypothetical protein
VTVGWRKLHNEELTVCFRKTLIDQLKEGETGGS